MPSSLIRMSNNRHYVNFIQTDLGRLGNEEKLRAAPFQDQIEHVARLLKAER